MKRIKVVKTALLLMLAVFLLAGCWDQVEIEDRLFVLAIGIDKTEEADKKTPEDRYTLSFVAPIVAQVKEGEGPAFNTYKTMSNTVITSLSQLLERFSQKQFYGHTRGIFFGEEIMKDEELLKGIIDGVTRYHELHNSMYAYIVPGKAEKVFEVEPLYDRLLMPYIAGITDNSDYTAKIMKLTLADMIIMLNNQKGSLVIPKIIPEKTEVKMNGAGVLKDYKLIGYLGDQEVAVYNWLTDKAGGGNISVEYEGVSVAFRHFTFRRNIELSKIEGGKIYLNYKMNTEGSIEEYMLGKKLLDDATLKEIEKELEKRIEGESIKLAKKFQEEYRVDLIGARDYLSKHQPKLFKTVEKDYDRYFTDGIVINVTADVHIRRVGLIK
ncbi:MAG TPA: Ger(x)C family spore germination protein [Clostridia bacterium]|nr:Ger(x)C family spore germination protein [Clostridia bacterium]